MNLHRCLGPLPPGLYVLGCVDTVAVHYHVNRSSIRLVRNPLQELFQCGCGGGSGGQPGMHCSRGAARGQPVQPEPRPRGLDAGRPALAAPRSAPMAVRGPAGLVGPEQQGSLLLRMLGEGGVGFCDPSPHRGGVLLLLIASKVVSRESLCRLICRVDLLYSVNMTKERFFFSLSLTKDQKFEILKKVVLQFLDGKSVAQIKSCVPFSIRTIYRRISRFYLGGLESLRDRKRTGRPRKWTDWHLAWIRIVVLDQDPNQYKFEFAWWTA